MSNFAIVNDKQRTIRTQNAIRKKTITKKFFKNNSKSKEF